MVYLFGIGPNQRLPPYTQTYVSLYDLAVLNFRKTGGGAKLKIRMNGSSGKVVNDDSGSEDDALDEDDIADGQFTFDKLECFFFLC